MRKVDKETMRALFTLVIVVLVGLVLLPDHLWRWEVPAIGVGVVGGSMLAASVYVRIWYGHWPK